MFFFFLDFVHVSRTCYPVGVPYTNTCTRSRHPYTDISYTVLTVRPLLCRATISAPRRVHLVRISKIRTCLFARNSNHSTFFFFCLFASQEFPSWASRTWNRSWSMKSIWPWAPVRTGIGPRSKTSKRTEWATWPSTKSGTNDIHYYCMVILLHCTARRRRNRIRTAISTATSGGNGRAQRRQGAPV